MAEKKNLTDVFKERKGKAETDAQSGTSAVEKLTQSGLPPSRQGKRRLELWLSPDAKKQVKLIAIDEEKSQEQVMADALNLLFKSRGILKCHRLFRPKISKVNPSFFVEIR